MSDQGEPRRRVVKPLWRFSSDGDGPEETIAVGEAIQGGTNLFSSSVETQVSDHDPPETPTKAARALIAWFAGALAFESVHAYAEAGSLSAAFGYGIGAIAVAIIDYKLKALLANSPRLVQSLNSVAADARWWVAAAMLSLFIIAVSPYVELRRWPYADWFKSIDVKSTLEAVKSETNNEKIPPPKSTSGSEVGYLTLNFEGSTPVVTTTSAAIKEATVEPARMAPIGLTGLASPQFAVPLSITFDKDYGPFDVLVARDPNGSFLDTVPNIAVTSNEADHLEVLITPSNSLAQMISPVLLSFRRK